MKLYRGAASFVLGMLLASPAGALAASQYSSQFLDIHPQLTPDPSRPGVMKWEKAGFNLAKYDRVMFAPLTMFVDPESQYKGLDSDDVRALATGFRDTIVRVLEPEIPVVDVPGKGVLYVTAALTNVRLRKKKRGLLGYTPIGFVMTTAMELAGKRISLENAALEMEIYDSATREPVAVIVDRHPSEKTNGGEEYSWKSIEETMTLYAKRFKARWLAAHEHH